MIIEALDERRERRIGPTTPDEAEPARDDDPAVEDGSERLLVCAACEHVITTADARQPFGNGAWEERFVNPHGVLFCVGRYARAPGCVARGAPSSEFSWFAGHSWQIQLCSGCLSHLGWLFRPQAGDGPSFFGLRSEMLREVDCPR